jgi:hypothetical protein
MGDEYNTPKGLRNSYKILIGEPERTKPLLRPV